jgi:hypothetical protein
MDTYQLRGFDSEFRPLVRGSVSQRLITGDLWIKKPS